VILVTGATGTVGSRVVRALIERGHQVRALARDPERARGLFGDAVELAPGDFADPPSIRAALAGVTELFLSCADDPRRVGWESDTIDAAVSAGVSRIVKLSSLVAEPGAPVAFWDWHGRVEQHLREAEVNAVFLRSSFFMSNLLSAAEQVAREDRLYAPAGKARIAMIDPRDVGEAAATVLTESGHDGKTLVLTGPEALTYAQVAGELSAATGRDIAFIDVPDEDAKQGMVEAGLPIFVAEQIVRIHAMARQGVAEQCTPTVEALIGTAPRPFARFARDHAHAFTPSAVEAVR
jgi:uncharacterized protein YbjT (DUF2867 family)